MDSGESEEKPSVPSRWPTLKLPERGSNRRVTYVAGAILLGLILLRVATAHPLPTPSHLTPEAAVVGYLDALGKSNLPSTKAYLAPSYRPKAAAMIRALRADHVRLVSPSVSGAVSVGNGKTVTVTATLEVCYRTSSAHPYNCQFLSREPLGLPSSLSAVYIQGRWYVSTLLKPTPLSRS
jgi:hypothetical protein